MDTLPANKSSKFWEIKDGRMVRKFPYKPTVEKTSNSSADGLTLTVTETKTFTFNLEQLKFAVTADKLLTYPVTRDQALKVLSGLIRENRLELFGTYDGYRIITNGYGQFKEIQFSHSNPLKVDELFRMLERCV